MTYDDLLKRMKEKPEAFKDPAFIGSWLKKALEIYDGDWSAVAQDVLNIISISKLV